MIKDKKVLRKLDVVFGVVLLIISACILWVSANMPVSGLGGAMQVSFWIAPGALPVVVSSIMIILSIFLIHGAWKEGARVTGEDVQKAIKVMKTPEAIRVYIMSALLIVYIFLMLGNMPYLASTFIFLSVFMFLFKAGHPLAILVVSAAATIAVWYCFGQIVMIPLP